MLPRLQRLLSFVLLALTLLGCMPVMAVPQSQEIDTAPMAFTSLVPVCDNEPCLIAVNANGYGTGTLNHTAQCSGRFPDYIERVPENYAGPRFRLSQEYPTTLPATIDQPWKSHTFTNSAEIDDYLFSLRQYIYDDMLPHDWVAGMGGAESWYHIPWMNVGNRRREFIHGLTAERTLDNEEIGLGPDARVSNYGIGYYNAVGGYVIGQVWAEATNPKPELTRFPEGTVVVKILFSDAKREDFADGVDILEGAPAWDVYFNPEGAVPPGIYPMRLLQLDIAVRDNRAAETGWVFGTLAYDRNATVPAAIPTEHVGWYKMQPVGLMWGNDPTLTNAAFEAGQRPQETLISTLAPAYSTLQLGRDNRLIGPVDNPASSCLSCHSTAQHEALAGFVPLFSCNVDGDQLWFRNLPGNEPFGKIDRSSCTIVPPGQDETLIALDYSLQMGVALADHSRVDQVNETTQVPTYHNPCLVDMQLNILRSMNDIPIRANAETYPIQR